MKWLKKSLSKPETGLRQGITYFTIKDVDSFLLQARQNLEIFPHKTEQQVTELFQELSDSVAIQLFKPVKSETIDKVIEQLKIWTKVNSRRPDFLGKMQIEVLPGGRLLFSTEHRNCIRSFEAYRTEISWAHWFS